jgi:hypothetical protein
MRIFFINSGPTKKSYVPGRNGIVLVVALKYVSAESDTEMKIFFMISARCWNENIFYDFAAKRSRPSDDPADVSLAEYDIEIKIFLWFRVV